MIRLTEKKDRDGVLALAHQFAVSFKVEDRAFMQSWKELIARPDACLLVAEDFDRIAALLAPVWKKVSLSRLRERRQQSGEPQDSGDTRKVRLIEEDFHRLMFETEGA